MVLRFLFHADTTGINAYQTGSLAMDWIKNVLLDVVVTVLIVLAATLDLDWARWIVLVYTPLMVLLKLVAFFGSRSVGQLKFKDTGVPGWFFHLLYAVNVLVATVDRWWLVAGGWALIWLLSFAAESRSAVAAR